MKFILALCIGLVIVVLAVSQALPLPQTTIVFTNDSATTTPVEHNAEIQSFSETATSTTTESPIETGEREHAETDTSNTPAVPQHNATSPTIEISLPIAPTPVISNPQPSVSIPYSFDEINVSARNALVNILCIAEAGTDLPSFTGSGIVVDPRGIILTNAHVAERMLFKDYKIQNALACTIRNGSPARDAYIAELLYIPHSWVEKNASSINDPSPSGTGEDDYAFLRITQPVYDNSLPASFPYIPIETSDIAIAKNNEVLAAAYPAGFMTDRGVQNALYPITALALIKDLYTFTKNTLDLISLGGSPVSQKGSSGGAILNARGSLIALIVTSTDAATTGERDLGAITLSHVSRSMKSNSGLTIQEFLLQDPATSAKLFQETVVPGLTAKLIEEYEKK